MEIEEIADLRAREILVTQPQVRQVVVDSPPGAGKTGIVERLAIQSCAVHGERVAVATQTNAQSFDIAGRLARGWPKRKVFLFTKRGLALPDSLVNLENLSKLRSLDDLPQGPCLVVGNSSKWSFVGEAAFDLMIVDEAYQLKDSQFVQIAGLADRHILVGDPGQIAPVVSADVSRWQGMADGPHVPAPKALLRRRPNGVLRVALPVTRRLPADSVQFVQPVFYPQLPFQATASPTERRLVAEPDGSSVWDGTIQALSGGHSIVMAELPPRITGEFDSQLSGGIADLIRRMLAVGGKLVDGEQQLPLTANQVGVVCGHRSQVYAVQEALGEEMAEVYVETAERYQGLERRVVIVHHPLSGQASASDFQADSGRLCVMLSRHRIACVLVTRGGLEDNLHRAMPGVERALSVAEDPAWEGYSAQQRLLGLLREQGRVLRVEPR